MAAPPDPWHAVTTDCITELAKSAAKLNATAVFVDEVTKYVIHFIL